jgi:hypoxanthine phosphoribosyltransferase
MGAVPPACDLEVLIDAASINRRVGELAGEISKDYRGTPVSLIGILKGSWIFLADLVRHLKLDVTVDFLRVQSYGRGVKPSGEVKITKDLDHSIEGLNVLVVEDILDTGETFHYLRDALGRRAPRTLKVVTLLDKPSRRTRPVKADYVGFTIPDVFVVGYGLDFAQQYRNLPDVRIFNQAEQ